MSQFKLEGLEDTFDDTAPTQRRPKGVGVTPSTLTPPPVRVKEGEDQHVDMKAILSEPPRLSEHSVDPWPLLPPPPRTPNEQVAGSVSVLQSDEWSIDRTPPPLVAEYGSVAPTILSDAPPSDSSTFAPVHFGWKVATAGLAATLMVAAIALFAPFDKVGVTQTVAAAGAVEAPPVISVGDLPVVGLAESAAKPSEPVMLTEVSIRSEPVARREVDEPVDRKDEDLGEGAAEATSPDPVTAEESPAMAPSTLPAFDRDAAASALAGAASSAASCRQSDTPAGTVRVSVTFAPSGRVTTASVSGAFAGTPVGGCIAKTFRSLRVEPFEGTLVTVHKTVTVR